MTIKTASPGIFVQEIDLTRGTADAITQNVGFCVGPFKKGPVDQTTYITEEVEFKRIFGEPTDENYEYWHSINNFLEYSGTCYVVRADDEMGDAVDKSTNVFHPQKMRNSTDHFQYLKSGDKDPTIIEQSETTSALYIKNQEDYFVTKGGLVTTQYSMNSGQRVPGTGGVFIGRTPGAWSNGIGVAIIDKGADYQLTLKKEAPLVSTSKTIIASGGDAAFDPNNELANTPQNWDGGTAQVDNRPLASMTDLEKTAVEIFPEEGETDTTVPVGAGVARYAKLVPTSLDFDPVSIDTLGVVEGYEGSNLRTDEGDLSGLRTAVDVINVTTDDGNANGTGLKVNLAITNGKVTAANVYSASTPAGYRKGDRVKTNIPGVAPSEQAVIEVTAETSPEGTVLKFGGSTAIISSVEMESDDSDAAPLYYTVAISPIATLQETGSTIYGDYGDGDVITNQYGSEIGSIKNIYDLGEFVFYRTNGTQVVDVIWEGKTYSRNEGMQYNWPNLPFDGEIIYKGKAAVNTAGNPIYDIDDEGNQIEVPVGGVATVTGATGDIIFWDAIQEKWVTDYVPKQSDYIYNPINNEVHQIIFTNDWYSQQVAFSGIPWSQFAPRPGTSAQARELGAMDDEMNIIVYDALGNVTNQKGSVLESYFLCSKFKGGKTMEGSDNYYANLLNNNSEFIYSNERVREIGFNHSTGDDGVDEGINYGRVVAGTVVSTGLKAAYLEPRFGALNFDTLAEIADQTMIDVPYLLLGGEDQLTASLGELQAGYSKIEDENVSDLDYILQGPASDLMTYTQSSGSVSYSEEVSSAVGKANFIISIAENLKTCIALVSPPRCAALDPVNAGKITQNIIQWANRIASSSYAVIDSGYKYMYDRFSDKYRYVPMNADIAGAMANTSLVSEPFFSPAGMSRGQIKHVVKLGYDPSKAQRDQIFTARVNPIVTFPGEGTVLYGDKTALAYSSAFSRINVRKLFIYCEREIAKIAKSVLFEFNDVPTRVLFKNNVNPFLRDVQSKRGLTDFLVVCDPSNNTPEVIDRNEFVADIYIKPNRSINFVQLTFVATKSGVSFGEAVAIVRRNNLVNQ